MGQTPGINQNPRDLTDDGFQKAIKSIRDFPEMLEARELVVIEYNILNKYIVIGGNQRLRALKHLGYTEALCKVVNWSKDQINEFIIKDNLSYGSWDWNLIANEWDEQKLIDWGLDIPVKYEEDLEPETVESIPIYIITIETENKLHFENVKGHLDKLQVQYKESEK